MKDIRTARWFRVATVLLAGLVLVASLLGLLTAGPYAKETENWLLQARGQDIGNLLAAATLLVSAQLFTKRGGYWLLVWLGTVMYLLYAYVIYAFAVHFNELFLLYVAILGMSFYLVFHTVWRAVGQYRYTGTSPFASNLLIGIGVAFALLWLSEIIPALLTGEVPESITEAGVAVNAVHVLDLSIVLPAFVMAGYMAKRKHPIGVTMVAPLLTFSVLMGASIVATMLLMVANGDTESMVPMVAVGALVVTSFIALTKHLRYVQPQPIR